MKYNKARHVIVRVLAVLAIASFWASSPSGISRTMANANPDLERFIQTQQSELKTISSTQKAELKVLKKANEKRLKEWKKKEDDARHAFFESHTLGSERRPYITDYLKRLKEFKDQLREEQNQKAREFDKKLIEYKQEQSSQLKDFQKGH